MMFSVESYGSIDHTGEEDYEAAPSAISEQITPLADPKEQKEESSLVHRKYPEELSVEWRLAHSLPFASAGTMFFIGSFYYYPRGNMAMGGIIFVIGGAAFLFADTWEWWTNNRVGCIYYEEYRLSYERSLQRKNWFPEESDIGRLQRAENGLNFGLSILGSFLYFLGAFFFLPPYNYMVQGLWIFITGSVFIMIAQVWKVYRSVNVSHIEDEEEVIDWDGVTVDTLAGLGGSSYLVGSAFFLPWIDTSNAATMLAANCFLLGGLFYVASGVFLIKRYFFGNFSLFPSYEGDAEPKLSVDELYEGLGASTKQKPGIDDFDGATIIENTETDLDTPNKHLSANQCNGDIENDTVNHEYCAEELTSPDPPQ